MGEILVRPFISNGTNLGLLKAACEWEAGLNNWCCGALVFRRALQGRATSHTNGKAVRSNWRNRDSVELSVRRSWGEECDTVHCRTPKRWFFFYLFLPLLQLPSVHFNLFLFLFLSLNPFQSQFCLSMLQFGWCGSEFMGIREIHR